MKKQFTNKARYLGLKLTAIIFALLLFASGQSWGQTVFTDDFSTNTNATYTTSGAIGTSAWTVTRSGEDWGGRRNTTPAQLELTNDASATSNVAGWVFGSTSTSSFSSPYNTTLSSNTGLVTWTFNMRQPRTDPAGFASGSYGVAFVLGGTSTSINNTGTGYAVVLGQSGATDPVRLARYNNGLQGTVTNIITSNTTGLTDFGTEYLSIKVTYDPSNNQWELFMRNDGASAFADPTSGTLTSQGTATDNTYTGTSLTVLGGYWQGSTGANLAAFFDNVTVSLTSSGNTAPTVTSSAATSIGSTTATLNGNVTSDGGATITERGFVYKTTAGVTISDNKTTVSGTTGSFTLTPTLSAGQQYFFKAYAINSVGTTLSSPELSFYTLSNEPTAHASSFSATANSQTQIELAFSAASTITNAAGYLILQRSGAAPTGAPADATSYSVGNTIGDGTVAAIISSTSSTSAQITSLTAGTQYYFALFPYNGSASTINYKTDGTVPTANATTVAPLDATSEVSGPALVSQPNPTIISSLVTTDGAAVRVFDMHIYDFGTDGQPTKVTQLTIKAGSNNTANWANTIQGVKLSTDAGSTFVTIGTPTIAASSIVIPITSGNLNIPDAGASTVSMYIYLKSSGLTDNDILEFKVDATASSHGFTADATGSTLLATFASAPVSNEILVDVEATKLAFVQQPSNTSPNVAMTPAVTVEATDANNNRDIDYATDINITSSGTLTGSPVAVTPASGIATFSTLTHTVVGNNLTLTAASGTLSNAISNNFSISSLLLVEDFDYANGALLTANGWTAHSTGINPITVATNSISYSNYLSSNVGKEITLATSGEDINKTFTAQTSGSVYASFLVNVTSSQTTGDYFFHIGPTPTSGNIYQGRIYIKKDASTTNFAFGLNKASTAGTLVYSGFNYVPGTTYLVVLKYKFNTGSTTDDVVSLFINPTLNSIEPTPLLTVTDATITDLTKADFVALRQGSSSNAAGLIIDGIRVSTNWSDIVGITPTFTGTGNWTETARWNTGSTPGTTAYAIIDGDATISGNVEVADITINASKKLTVATTGNLKVTGTLTNNAGNTGLVLKSDATGTASLINSTAGVSATVERYLTGNVFHQLGLPISNTIAAGTSAGQTGDVFKYCTLDSYDEATNNYVSLGSGNNVTSDKGYVVKYVAGTGAPAFRTLSFTGTLNTGTVNIPMTKTADGYNLIPNPYPSSIDWNAASGWTKNVDANNSIYIWKSSGQWTIFDGTNDININGGVRYIAPGQAFFIKAAATGNITMDNNVRVHNATSYLKSANTIADNLIKIKVSGNANSITDEAVVYFANNPASSGSEKWFSYEATAPSLYTVKSNKNYAINVLSDANTSIAVPMAFKAGANGNYTLKATEIGNFTLCSGVTLEDLKTGSTQNILTNTVYNFTATTTDNVNRFILHFASSVGVNEIGKTNGGIYAYDNNIYVNANEQVKQIAVYNTIGQLVKTVNNVNGLQKINMNGNATGYYIVKVICDKNVYSEKVLIK